MGLNVLQVIILIYGIGWLYHIWLAIQVARQLKLKYISLYTILGLLSYPWGLAAMLARKIKFPIA